MHRLVPQIGVIQDHRATGRRCRRGQIRLRQDGREIKSVGAQQVSGEQTAGLSVGEHDSRAINVRRQSDCQTQAGSTGNVSRIRES